MFLKYLRNGICFAQYLDGSSMMVGQKLDNIISFLYALACYLNETGDTSVLNDSVISDGLSYIFQIIDAKYDAKTGLYFTQITPDNYYIKDNKNIVTFNNVFLWSVLKSIESFNIRGRVDTEKLFKNINDHCVIKSDYGLCYCYIMDNEGNKYLGDDNQGSLTLLPYLKFCSNEFAIYTTTMEYIYSENNPKYRSSGKLFGCACETVPKYPKLMGLCSYLMSNGFSFQYVNSIKNVNLPNMVACTTFDVANGEAKTGIYNASLAGYLAYTFILLYS
ncbi:MAG: glycoside hydrolase family 125 protein [Oscillospiraceae bacterium]|nr:glycoside hydrolase family 125 protein [Oscillospiraceae bacterium]